MGRNSDFHNKKLLLSSLMGIRLAMLEMTRVGVGEDDDEVMLTMEKEADEAMRMMKKSWMWVLLRMGNAVVGIQNLNTVVCYQMGLK